jgi:transcription-repair coupling factor (superfamily II helicase)
MMNFYPVLTRCGAFNNLLRSLQNDKTPVACFGLSHIHRAHFAAGIFDALESGGVVLTPDENAAMRFAEDLRAFLPEASIYHYPVKEVFMLDVRASSGDVEHVRIRVLEAVRRGKT